MLLIMACAYADVFEDLNQLDTHGPDSHTGYSRAKFGERWADVDRNHCDTRNDILGRDLIEPRKDGNCIVLDGTLFDPYTETFISFRRGPVTSSAVQIDHIVSLSNAWDTGAQQLSPLQRTMLANDPLNLLAVDGRQNQSKGDGDASEWLPLRWRCEYVEAQIAVKLKYNLWVTPSERDAMVNVLRECW